MRNSAVSPRRTQLGRFVMYAIAFVAGVIIQPMSHDPLTGGVVFLGLFAPIDLFFEFLFGLLADYRESHEAAASGTSGRSRREARRAIRQGRSPGLGHGGGPVATGGSAGGHRAGRH